MSMKQGDAFVRTEGRGVPHDRGPVVSFFSCSHCSLPPLTTGLSWFELCGEEQTAPSSISAVRLDVFV